MEDVGAGEAEGRGGFGGAGGAAGEGAAGREEGGAGGGVDGAVLFRAGVLTMILLWRNWFWR